MQVDGNIKGGLNELLAAMLNSKNKYIPKNELKQILKRIEDDATEIYHTKYGSDGTRIKFNINSNEDPCSSSRAAECEIS
jgi:hypothetical protein